MHWKLHKYKKLAKGFRGRAKNVKRIMVPKVEKAQARAYHGRKLRPRELKKEWIMTINAAVREHNLTYSQFIWALNRSNMELNRMILADLAVNEPYSFKCIVDEIKLQSGFEGVNTQEFSLFDALGQGHLVYGKVKGEQDAPKFSKYTLDYIQVRKDIPQQEQDKVVFLKDE